MIHTLIDHRNDIKMFKTQVPQATDEYGFISTGIAYKSIAIDRKSLTRERKTNYYCTTTNNNNVFI